MAGTCKISTIIVRLFPSGRLLWGGAMRDAFLSAIDRVADVMENWSAPAHWDLDEPEFTGTLPAFTSPDILGCASTAVEHLAMRRAGIFAPDVHLGQWAEPPSWDDVRALQQLAPWQAPSMWFLGDESGSAYAIRRQFLHQDVEPDAPGVRAWLVAHRFDESSHRWGVSTMFKSVPANRSAG